MATREPAAFPVAFHRPEAERRVVILPGARYPTRGPLLWFAREVALAKGFGVLEVLDEPPTGEDPFAWVRDRALRALDHQPAPTTVVIGKSLASDVADLAADRELPAIWLTPLLDRPNVRAALARATRPLLIVGGTADPTWQPDAVPSSALISQLELPEHDHSLQRPGDPLASIASLRKVTKQVERFLGGGWLR
ncbi:alpha/beta hydrolase [Conexibacter arvalis]|uniref:Pimeloyl-ACP methyl ester carboxylesterase n=1 Tax=Conexibacter arvalis TaxID=912552 RepID=A0A840IGP7_9ACTN|nr:alpha/beta hydrolase [Conexibacter arvalis]MBB4664052.1 pimeloyl-ACP methyl ester carboxylesterase [Conexibacter arvalis]